MESKLVFNSYSSFCVNEICSIFTRNFSEKKFFHICLKASKEIIIGLKFSIDKNTKKSFDFEISKLEYNEINIKYFCVDGDFYRNKSYKDYCFLIDFAYEKYGFESNEKSYRNLNYVIHYLFYLYCLNSLDIDCREFSINPYAKEKNCAFFEEVFKRIWCTKKQKFIFCFLFFQTYFYFKSFDFYFFF